MFRGKKRIMPKTTRCGQQKDGAFEEELAKRMERVDATKAVTRQGAT